MELRERDVLPLDGMVRGAVPRECRFLVGGGCCVGVGRTVTKERREKRVTL